MRCCYGRSEVNMRNNKLKMSLKAVVLSALLPLVSNPALAAGFTFTNNSMNRVCNDKYRNIELGIKVDNARLDGDFKSDSSGCLTFSLRVNSCKDVRIFAIDTAHSGQEFYEGSCRTSGGGSSGGSGPGTGGTVTKPSLSSDDMKNVRTTAENSAREFANAEVKNMDLAPANYAFNYILGLLQADRDFTPGSKLYESAQTQGAEIGSQQGTPHGNTSGMNAALSAGTENGMNQVTEQYRQMALNPSGAKNWTAKADPTLPSYSGGSYTGSAETSEFHILSQKTYQVRSRINNSDLDSAILNKDVDFDIGTTWFNKSRAFENYKLKFSGSDHMRYYNKLAEKYENGSEAQNLFGDVFSATYKAVIDEKMEKVVKVRNNQEAFTQGRNDGALMIQTLAYNQSYNNSFVSSAQEAARTAFASSYPKAYSSAFTKKEQFLEKNSVIEGLQVDIVDSEGKKEFVIGQPVTLVIKNMINIGRMSETLNIVLSESINAKETLTVNGLSQVKDQKFIDIASISPVAKLGKSEVKVCVGIACSQHMIELKWENQIKGLAKEGVDDKAAALLSAFIRGALLDEWKKVYVDYQDSSSNGKTIYDKLENVAGKQVGEYIVDKKSYLGLFFEAMRVNKSAPGFKARVMKIGEEYLALKKAMLDLNFAKEKVRSGGIKIIAQLANDTSPKEYRLNQLPSDQQDVALNAYVDQMNEFYQQIENDPVLKKQMSDCTSKSKKSTVSCVQFLDNEENKYFKAWTLGNANMVQKLTELNARVGVGAKK